jgi:hypothetical protein
MEPARGDLQDDVMKSIVTDELDTDVYEWRETWHSALNYTAQKNKGNT